MTSLRMRIKGACMRPVIRTVMSRIEDPQLVRKGFALCADLGFKPAGTYDTWTETMPNGASGRWIGHAKAAPDQVLFYIHGGGYICGSPETHEPIIARCAQDMGLRAFAPRYRLAPEHPVPAQLEDVRRAYHGLIDAGYAPENIVLGGESAGGGLVLALLSELCQAGMPPRCSFAWSPFCDQTFSGASVQENGKKDHFFPGDRVEELAEMILGEFDPKHPAASPLFAAFPGCTPVLLQASSDEILRDDAMRMERVLSEAGTDVRLEIWDGAPHAWQLFAGHFPEAQDAIDNTTRFVRAQAPQQGES